ncbi:MAG: M28 family peptidase [Candidatus Aminicenantes bacterium]|nr:MAG: M28 family peptidase [Candidatus Aminicenantes bacterium]
MIFMRRGMMKSNRLRILTMVFVLCAASCGPGDSAHSRGAKMIRAEDMKFPLQFLAAPEFRGRNTPSTELDIASKYIALMAERIGLKPLMPGGSYYQEVPVEVTTIVPQASRMRLTAGAGERIFHFPADAIIGRNFEAGKVSGEAVFLGYGLGAPQLNWDDTNGLELKGKVAVILDAALPDDHVLKPADNRRLLMSRAGALRGKGAIAVVTIINQEREARLAEKGLTFSLPERLRFPDVVTGSEAMPSQTAAGAAPAAPAPPFFQVEVRHDAGAAILGVAKEDLVKMIETIRQGKRVAPHKMPGRRLEIELGVVTRQDTTLNVVAYAEGTDPVLRNEYLTISSHHDHLGMREGRIYPGADDNASGVVGMFEIAEALMVERPKRSVIFVWNTAEERGLVGSYYFVQHCPVPVDKISANLNLDMISRNDTNQLYLIGSNKISSELDASIQTMNTNSVGLTLDYKYEDPAHPDRFFFRSDQYPYIRYGIPGVWFFCGTTEDYHTEGDIEAKADYAKMEKVSKLVYLVAMDIGNKPALLSLDLKPEIKVRGEQNMKVGWR